MNPDIFSNISKIIERDSKATTYKFALLRGVIDIIQDNSPFVFRTNERVFYPVGLMIEKWLLYYYPILASSTPIPQINGDTRLAFEMQYRSLIQRYESIGGFSAFYNDLKHKGIPKELEADFVALTRQMKQTITTMPMKYIGRSLNNDFYSIFQFVNDGQRSHSGSVDAEYLIHVSGSFSIPEAYHEAFKIIGTFVSGQDSILFKWAEFSVNASSKSLSVAQVVNEVLKSPITERDVIESKRIFREMVANESKVYCVWTGEEIRRFDVDHVIPFSVWKNNDLWNLLPSRSTINNAKRDKIPSPGLIENRKDLIVHYWEMLNQFQEHRFQKEIRMALIGNNIADNWKSDAIEQLKNSCMYLINKRGYEPWMI
jgi:hypothetical protein